MDTIAAVGTPAGRGAIAVLRVSGVHAFDVAARLIRPWPLILRRATLCRITDPEDETLIDQAIVCAYDAPRTYTGEDIVELSCHGGVTVSTAVLRALLTAGAREALPGEFTRRAVLNGKLDLVQAEAIGDLIDAPTESLRRIAVHQLDGGLSRAIEHLRTGLLDLEALLAYDIDFPEEDDGPVSRERVTHAAQLITATLERLVETAAAMEVARDGAVVVIGGRPNVGKSALFNAIIGEARAIVTDIPGTTRDAIEARLEIGNWPVRLVDTAGLRSATDTVERLGIEVSERYLSQAHVVLLCADDPDQLGETIRSVRSLTRAVIIAVLTKADCDLVGARWGDTRIGSGGESPDVARVSAYTRYGLRDLLERIRRALDEHVGTVPVDRPAVTRTRHRLAIAEALTEVMKFRDVWRTNSVPATIAAVHIRSAVASLDELIGAVTVDDVLERLFSTFCVGK